MRNIIVVLTLSYLCCVSFALNLNSTVGGAFARDLNFVATQDSQEEVDSNDASFDFNASLGELSDERASKETETEGSVDVSAEFDAGLDDEKQGAEESGDVEESVADEGEENEDLARASDGDSVESDEFQIDQDDILGSAFSGIVSSSDFTDDATFDFEEDFAVERVGSFSAGVWLKERVEQKKTARETERVKYADAVDVPDEYKTIDDFFVTLTDLERAFVRQEEKPQDAYGWFQLARKLATVGRLEFAKRALEESFLAEPGEFDADFLSNDELETDARQSGLDDAYVRLERGAFERLCVASFEYWSDAERFDDEYYRLFDESKRDVSSLVRAGDYGAARFCRLSLDKYPDLKIDSQGKVVFGKKSDDSINEKEFNSFSQTAAAYFERVGFGALIATLWNEESTAAGTLVDAMKYTREPYVSAELGLYYYDESRPKSLRAMVGNVLQLQYGRIPTRPQVVVTAYKQALGYYNRSVQLPGETFPKTDSKQTTSFGADAKTFIWRWDAEKQAPSPVLVNVEYAYLYEAARLARAADKLASDNHILNKEARLLAIATTGELTVARVGADFARFALNRFDAACPNLSSEDLALAAQFAIRSKRCRGALIPMILLGDKADSTLFNSTRGKSSVVVQGASCADRRVRYEALRAVLKSKPRRDFTGSQIVVRALEWFASAKGERVVVVLAPESSNFEKLETLITRFAGFGFTVKIGRTVHEMLVEVQDEADLEFVFLPDGLESTTLQSAVKTLRMEQTTAETPILVGTLSESADVFNLETDELAGLRFYDSVVPSNASCRLRTRQAKCAAQALELIKKIKSDALDKNDKNPKNIYGEPMKSAPSYPPAYKKSNESAQRSKSALQKSKTPDPKSKGKVTFK